MNKKFTIISSILILIGLFITAVIWFRDPRKDLSDLLFLGGWILFFMRLLYDNWSKFYFEYQKIKHMIFNYDTRWDFSIEYKGDFNKKELNKTINTITNNYKDNYKINEISNSKYYVTINNIMRFELTYYENYGIPDHINPSDNTITINSLDIPTSYRKSKEVLNNQLLPFIELIEDNMNLMNKDKLYTLDINFLKPNPYFGVFIRKLSLKDVADFNIKMNIQHSSNVSVTKKKIKINTSSLSNLINLTEKYLALSPKDLEV